MANPIPIDRARRIALAAQGFSDSRPTGRVDVRHFRRVLERTKLVQLDSVNVLARAHYMPFFSRLGAYSKEALDGWLWRSGEMFEYWAHEACAIPLSDRSLFTWRMDVGRHWPGVERVMREQPELVERVYRTVAESGPIRVGEIDGESRTEAWWGWTDTKLALEYLFLTGRLTVADRPNFTRMYDLPERVHPHALNAPGVDEKEARKEMLRRAIHALGIGTVNDILDYYRLRGMETRSLVQELVGEGAMVAAEVEGWKEPVFIDPAAVDPRSIHGAGFLSPFDPVTWCRPRTERLFEFHYRIEIYVPAPKRVFGYYVLPFRMADRLVGRVDLKADRKEGKLLVKGAFAEPGVDRVAVGRSMRSELEALAAWLDLGDVVIEKNGDLATALA